MATLGFDIYGTLIDTAGITDALRPYAGERAPEFAAAWRAKQLEYAFRRGLMQNFRDFAVCTEQALDWCCLSFGVKLAPASRDGLLTSYRALPPFPDALDGLRRIREAGLRAYAFSMGRADDVAGLLEASGLGNYLDGVVSLQEPQMFKPSPAAYSYFARRVGINMGDAWLVSGNPFDVIGAVSAGMNGAWVKRSPNAIFDPWEVRPTVEVETVGALADAIPAHLGATAP